MKSNEAKVPFTGADIDFTISDIQQVDEADEIFFDSRNYGEAVKWEGGMYIIER